MLVGEDRRHRWSVHLILCSGAYVYWARDRCGGGCRAVSGRPLCVATSATGAGLCHSSGRIGRRGSSSDGDDVKPHWQWGLPRELSGGWRRKTCGWRRYRFSTSASVSVASVALGLASVACAEVCGGRLERLRAGAVRDRLGTSRFAAVCRGSR